MSSTLHFCPSALLPAALHDGKDRPAFPPVRLLTLTEELTHLRFSVDGGYLLVTPGSGEIGQLQIETAPAEWLPLTEDWARGRPLAEEDQVATVRCSWNPHG